MKRLLDAVCPAGCYTHPRYVICMHTSAKGLNKGALSQGEVDSKRREPTTSRRAAQEREIGSSAAQPGEEPQSVFARNWESKKPTPRD